MHVLQDLRCAHCLGALHGEQQRACGPEVAPNLHHKVQSSATNANAANSLGAFDLSMGTRQHGAIVLYAAVCYLTDLHGGGQAGQWPCT